jgi:xanthosine utilization system XapX-like protein
MFRYSHLLVRLLQSVLEERNRSRSGEISAENTSSAKKQPISCSNDEESEPDYRRAMAGFLAAGLLVLAAIGYATPWLENWTGSESTSQFVVSAMTRIGLVLGAIWLAWDSMRRPASWFPPGLAMVGVIGIVVIAAQPKLIFAIVPLLGGLAIFSSVLRAFRRR